MERKANIQSPLRTPITTATVSTQNMVASLQDLLTQRLTFGTLTPYSQKPALVEDALGLMFPLQLEFIRSWTVSCFLRKLMLPFSHSNQTVHSILNDRFSDRPGGSLVKKQRYVLQDDLSGRVFRWNNSPHFSIRPGQIINMSMVYYSDLDNDNICPRCGTVTVSSINSETEW